MSSSLLLRHFNKLRISEKLKFISWTTSILAGSISILVILMYQYYKEKAMIEESVKTLSHVIAENISPALVFNDQNTMRLTLSSLKNNNNIKQAYALDKQYNIVSDYATSSQIYTKDELTYFKDQNAVWKENSFHLLVPISHGKEKLGSLIVIASIDDFFIGIFKETFILILIVLGAMLISNRYSNTLTVSMLNPLAKLNENINDIIKTQDLKQSVEVYNKDEIGGLAGSFNQMLEDLHASQEELKKYQYQLETMVQARTQELNKKSKELESLNKSLDHRIKEAVKTNSEQEQMLIQQSRSAAMGEMIGNIAHQWRQPLNALNLLMQNIYFAFESGELELEELERLTTKGERLMKNMSKTIDDFRDFFKPNKEKRVFDISEGIRQSVDLISVNYKSHNIKLEQKLDSKARVLGYENEFAQVVLNILANAKDIIKEKHIKDAEVSIESYCKDKKVMIEIQDNAGGVPEEILPKVFDPYFTTKHKDEGTGIGLYMSKTIIEKNMSGILSVSNKDSGACFTITLNLEE